MLSISNSRRNCQKKSIVDLSLALDKHRSISHRNERHSEGSVHNLCFIDKKRRDCTISTIDCRSSIVQSPLTPPTPTFILSLVWINGKCKSHHIPIVQLVCEQLKASGRLMNMWIHVETEGMRRRQAEKENLAVTNMTKRHHTYQTYIAW